jgi:hypothetical protein
MPRDGRCSSDSGKDDLTTINKSFLPTVDEFHTWFAFKDKGGPTFAGSPSWKSHVGFIEEGFRKHGVVDIEKDMITYDRWFTSDDRKANDWSLSIDGKEIQVASYWAYSGSTGPSGVTAPLTHYSSKDPPASLEGKIVVFDTPALPDPLPPMFNTKSKYEYASDPENLPTDSFALRSWYEVAYYTRFGGFAEILTEGKAAGALVISNMGLGRAAGTYTLPLTPTVFGIPGLYLDRVAGEVVRDAAMKNRTATVKLMAKTEKAETYFLSGSLPGKHYGKEEDEMILLIAHTDGPNISQENGGLGILAVIEYFSHIPQEKRPKTLLVVLDPQHYMPGRHQVDWYELHPKPAGKIVASVAIEHLGQLEYREKGNDFVPTGEPEATSIFVQDNDLLIKMAIKAVKDHKLPRTAVYCPPKTGGRWEGMGAVALEKRIPGYGISADASAYWSTEARMDRFDTNLAWKQLAVMTQLVGELMKADLKEIAVP